MPEQQRFTVTEQHIKLLRAMNVSWAPSEFGAPAIDPKRPYGNGNVYRDMLRILYGSDAGEDDTYSDQLIEILNNLHNGTRIALQIVLATGVMEPGEYVAPKYTNKWTKV